VVLEQSLEHADSVCLRRVLLVPLLLASFEFQHELLMLHGTNRHHRSHTFSRAARVNCRRGWGEREIQPGAL